MALGFFSKEEIKALVVIFVVLVGISVPNFIAGIKRSRDTTRKNDFGSLVNTLNNFNDNYGFFPAASPDGRIIACTASGSTPGTDSMGREVIDFIPCEWGTQTAYLNLLPKDPQASLGLKYVYMSNGKRYQIFGHLEDKSQDEYSLVIEKRNISCGTKVCNYGRSYSKTPLDKTIEEYENEINAKN